MLTKNQVWEITKSFGGVAIAYNPVRDCGIYEVILPTISHKRQCAVAVTDGKDAGKDDGTERVMKAISDRRFHVSSEDDLKQVLRKL